MRNRLNTMGIEGKTHYKLYKSGKRWITAGITVFSIGLGLTFSQVEQANAATSTSTDEAENSASVSSSATTVANKTVVLTSSSSDTEAKNTTDTTAATSTSNDSQSIATSESSSASSVTASATSNSTNTSSSSITSATKENANSSSTSATSQGTETASVSTAATSSSSEASSQANSATSTATAKSATAATSAANGVMPAISGATATSDTTTVTNFESKATNMPISTSGASVETAATTSTNTIKDINGITLTIISSYGKSMTYKTDNPDIGAGRAGLRDLYTLVESQDNGIAEGDGLATIYVQDSHGNYLTDNSGQRVNLLYLMTNLDASDESLAANFTITYTNVAGTISNDVSAKSWGDLTDAGTYQLTITSVGIQALANILIDQQDSFSLPASETVVDFTPTFDSKADYRFQIKIIPATLGFVGTTTGLNEIKVSSDSQNYNGTISQSPKTIYLFDGTSKSQPAITITNGIVTAIRSADGSSANVGDVVFTNTDFLQMFNYTYTSYTDNLTGADVGKYTISLSKKGLEKLQAYLGQNFIVSSDSSATPTLMIKTAVLAISTADDNVSYNGKSHTTTVNVGANYDDINASDYTTTTGVNAGRYTITPVYVGSKGEIIARNYTVIPMLGTLIIDKAGLVVTVASTTSNYDKKAHGTTASVSEGTNYDHLVFTAVSDDNEGVTTYINAGTYKMTGITSDRADNYNITYIDGTIKIDKAILTVKVDDNTVAYDGQPHSTTVSISAGTNYDNLIFTGTSVDGSGTTAYTNAGTYAMTGTTSDNTDNYEITYENGILTIDKVDTTIMIPDGIYWSDGTEKNLTAVVDGTVNGETLNYSLTSGMSTVGTKTITATYDATNSINRNYVIKVTSGALTVGDIAVEHIYEHVGADGNTQIDTMVIGTVTHGSDTKTADYLNYTTAENPKIGYTLVSDNTGLAPNGKLTGIGGTVRYIYLANTETAVVTYVDQTTGKTLRTDSLHGAYGTVDAYTTTDKIVDYEKQGYELVSSTFPTSGGVYDEDGVVKEYTVTLKHKLVTVTSDNPGTPGQPINSDNPDGPKYPKGVTMQDLTKRVSQTIKYQYKNGDFASVDNIQIVTFNRSAIVDEVDGTLIYTDWLNGTSSTGSYTAVKSPIITGFTADRLSITGNGSVTNTTENMTVMVTYSANLENAMVTYVDVTTGKTLSEVDLTGDFNSPSDYRTTDTIAGYARNGYALVSDGYPASGLVFDQDGITNNYIVMLRHS